VRPSTGCSCGSRIVGSKDGSLLFLGSNSVLVPGTLETVRRGQAGGQDDYQTNFSCRLHAFCFLRTIHDRGYLSQPRFEYKQTSAAKRDKFASYSTTSTQWGTTRRTTPSVSLLFSS
jgi:hypothetical protein